MLVDQMPTIIFLQSIMLSTCIQRYVAESVNWCVPFMVPPYVQVEATKGALWDAFAETAIYMEILQLQILPFASARGEHQCRGHDAIMHFCSHKLINPHSLP